MPDNNAHRHWPDPRAILGVMRRRLRDGAAPVQRQAALQKIANRETESRQRQSIAIGKSNTIAICP